MSRIAIENMQRELRFQKQKWDVEQMQWPHIFDDDEQDEGDDRFAHREQEEEKKGTVPQRGEILIQTEEQNDP